MEIECRPQRIKTVTKVKIPEPGLSCAADFNTVVQQILEDPETAKHQG